MSKFYLLKIQYIKLKQDETRKLWSKFTQRFLRKKTQIHNSILVKLLNEMQIWADSRYYIYF
jgi:hypothetical protein